MTISFNHEPPIRVAILGGGAVTSEFYLPAAHLVNGVTITTIVEPNPFMEVGLRNAGFSGEFVGQRFETFFELANRTTRTIDAMIVALPNWLHEAATMQALKANYPVLVEKPLALTQAACERLACQEQKAGVSVSVGMVRRLTPSVKALKQGLSTDLIGDLVEIDIEDGSSYAWSSDSGSFFSPQNGGILADIGSHYLDLCSYLLGSVEPLDYEDDWHGGCEANSIFRLKTKNGVPIRMRLSRTYSLRNTAVFYGTKGKLILDKTELGTCLWELEKDQNIKGTLTPKQAFCDYTWLPTLISCFAQQLQNFEEVVRERNKPTVGIREATETVRLIEWAYEQRNQRKSSTIGLTKVEKHTKLSASPVVVTGGTGFIGGRLVDRLAMLQCMPITVPIRNYQTCVDIARYPVILRNTDLLNYEDVKQSLSDVHYVFHLAYGGSEKNAKQITLDGTKHVVEAAIEQNVKCIVILSTINVFGYPDTDSLVDESWPYHPTGGEYGISKAVMEKWCLERAKNSKNTRIVVLNPSCVYGPTGKTFTQMPLTMAQAGVFCWLDEGRGIANYTYVDNLVDAIILAATTESAHGHRIIINDGHATWREFLEPMLGPFAANILSYSPQALREIQSTAPKTGLRDLIQAAARSQEVVDVLNRMPVVGKTKNWLLDRFPEMRTQVKEIATIPVNHKNKQAESIPPYWLNDLFVSTSTRFSAQLAQTLLGWKPLIDLAEGQRRTVQWFYQAGLIN